LAAGEFRHRHVEPRLYPEKTRHFRDTQADFLCFQPKALKAKCQFVPYLVRDNLIFRRLPYKTYFCRRFMSG
jgi:hypothetical protein